MYNGSLSSILISKGTPAAATITAAGAWSQATGLVLLLLGGVGLSLSTRARGLRTRAFPANELVHGWR